VAQVKLERIFKRFSASGGSSSGAAASTDATAHADRPSVAENPSPSRPGDAIVLRGVDLTVEDGEFLVLVGSSGCGKSTLLRSIAGLETVTSGTITIGDRVVNDLPPKARNIAMVFQSYALYPHLTVYDNLAFGLRRTRGWSREEGSLKTAEASAMSANPVEPESPWWEQVLVGVTRSLPAALRYKSARETAIDRRVRQVAKTLQIDRLLDRRPKQLSGGQKQRVALGRAMARNPDVFLMDEPLSNLDAKLRAETRAQIVSLQRQLGITTIYVTHDQTEAMTMGDRIAIINEGQIVQLGQPMELYRRPVNRFVASFIGSPPMNFLAVRLKSPTTIVRADRADRADSRPDPSAALPPAQPFQFTLPDAWATVLAPYRDRDLLLGLRPEALSLGVPAPKNLHGTIVTLETLGSDTYVTIAIAPESELDSVLDANPLSSPMIRLTARLSADTPLALHESIWLTIDPLAIHLFDAATGIALFAAT
jgi:multiple sugar transport system ATP-binding protein